MPITVMKIAMTIAAGLLLNGCAVLASNPYYQPHSTATVIGTTGHGGPLFIRFGGQNMIMTAGKPVDVGIKSSGYIGGYVPMALGPLLPIFPLFLTAPDQPEPIILLQLYIHPHGGEVTVNPKAVTVTNGRGETFSPVRAMGPLKPRALPLELVEVTYDREEALRPGSDIPIPADRASCFLLQYDLGTTPDWNIAMSVDGIKAGTRPYPPETFTFERGSAVYLIWGGREALCAEID